MAIRFISDLYFGHSNILKYEPSRPGSTVEEMDAEIVRRWNSVVGDADTTYILGDVSWHGQAKTVSILNSMAGKKILIRGNHDRGFGECVSRCFEKVQDYSMLSMSAEGVRKVVLSHFPIPFFDSARYGACVHLYGHVHDTEQFRDIETRHYARFSKTGTPVGGECSMSGA